MKKTEWFPASVNPVHPGFYETERYEIDPLAKGIQILKWTGLWWEYAYDLGFSRKGERALMFPWTGDRWRGLMEKSE